MESLGTECKALQSHGWDLQALLGLQKECKIRNMLVGILAIQNCFEHSEAIKKSLITHFSSRDENWAYWQGKPYL